MCTELVEQEGVLLLPAAFTARSSDPAPQDRFRVGIGRLGPQEALERWDAFLSRRF